MLLLDAFEFNPCVVIRVFVHPSDPDVELAFGAIVPLSNAVDIASLLASRNQRSHPAIEETPGVNRAPATQKPRSHYYDLRSRFSCSRFCCSSRLSASSLFFAPRLSSDLADSGLDGTAFFASGDLGTVTAGVGTS